MHEVKWMEVDPSSFVAENEDSGFTLTHDAGQTLMDDLWHAGLRPTEGAGSAGAMRAVERHLEDMRTLVFKPNAPDETPRGTSHE